MKKQNYIYLLCFIFIANTLFSQTVKPNRDFVNNYYDAEAYMYENNYPLALPLLKNLEKMDPENPHVWYKLGYCLLNNRPTIYQAQDYLEKAVDYVNLNYKESHKERSVPIEAYLYLAEAYRANHEFDKSFEALNTLSEIINTNKIKNKELTDRINRCEEINKYAIDAMKNPTNVKVKNMGSAINSEYSDHSPVADDNSNMLYFTSKRPRDGEPQENRDEDIFVSLRKDNEWQEPKRLGKPVNTNYNNESVVGVSEDGKEIIFFQSNLDYTSAVFSSKDRGNGNWAKPKLLRYDAKIKARETHVTTSEDQQQMYFTSNRKGGYGGLDIYVINKLSDGTWSKPKLLPPNINTPYDEETPFLHPDGVTLYFSSKGHNTMGGYDIFYTKINKDGTYSDPVNLGYPVNSTNDDVAYTVNKDGSIAYFATVKPDGFGELDIYQVIDFDKLNKNFIAYEESLYDVNRNKITNAIIYVQNTTLDELIGIYRQPVDEKYQIKLVGGFNYQLTIEAPGFIKKVVNYSPTKQDEISFKKDSVHIQLEDILLRLYKDSDTVYFVRNSAEIDDIAANILKYVVNKHKDIDNIIVNITNKGYDSDVDKIRLENIKELLLNNNIMLEADNIYENDNYPEDVMEKAYSENSYIVNITVLDKQPELIAELPPIEQNEEEIDSVEKIVKTEPGDKIIEIENVLFPFDKYYIEAKNFDNLDKLANYLNDNPAAKISIGGHCDTLGSNEYNYLLSYNRSKSVKDYLVRKGNNPENIITEKFGRGTPIAHNKTTDGKDNPKGRQFNRRAEFSVLIQGSTARLVVKPLIVDDIYYNTSTTTTTTNINNNGVVYDGKWTLQIFALKQKKDADYFADLVGVKINYSEEDGFYRYYVGEFNTRQDAKKAMDELKKMGYEPFIRKLDFFEK